MVSETNRNKFKNNESCPKEIGTNLKNNESSSKKSKPIKVNLN